MSSAVWRTAFLLYSILVTCYVDAREPNVLNDNDAFRSDIQSKVWEKEVIKTEYQASGSPEFDKHPPQSAGVSIRRIGYPGYCSNPFYIEMNQQWCCPKGASAQLCYPDWNPSPVCCATEGSCCGTCPCPSSYPACVDSHCCQAENSAAVWGKWCCRHEGTCCTPDMCPCPPGEKCMAPLNKCCPITESMPDPVWCGTEDDGYCCADNVCLKLEEDTSLSQRRRLSRPSFKTAVLTAFRKSCVDTTQFPQYPFCNGSNVNLAHVRSWQKISGTITALISASDWITLKQNIDFLFKIDSEAVVWVGPGPVKQTLTHQNYMGNQLITVNGQYRTTCHCRVDAIANASTAAEKSTYTTDLAKLMNSAPANLRYGLGNPNKAIQAYLDPMGNYIQKSTFKEKYWLNHFGAEARGVQAGTVCNECTLGCDGAMASSSASKDGDNYYVCK